MFLADVDGWTISNWIIGLVGLILTGIGLFLSIRSWHRDKMAHKDVQLAEKDAEALRRHLMAIAANLQSLQLNIVESHGLGDVIKTGPGKRFLSSLAFQAVAAKNQTLIAWR